MNITPQQAATVFNEWAKRYADDPEAFGPILDEQGRPVEDYGENCAHYFEKLADELMPAKSAT